MKKQFILYRNECFGPIYTCICCIRDLFRRSVEELKGDLKRKILDEKNMHSMLTFDDSLIIKDEYQERNEKNEVVSRKRIQSEFCLCKTCIRYFIKGEMPPICSKNNLELPKIPQCFKELTNLEKQFIVKNLVFMKIRNLPKTRMEALNDRVINIPIQDDNIAKVVNTLPRSESNSGMVNVKLKKK